MDNPFSQREVIALLREEIPKTDWPKVADVAILADASKTSVNNVYDGSTATPRILKVIMDFVFGWYKLNDKAMPEQAVYFFKDKGIWNDQWN